MKCKSILVGALLLTFILGFTSIVLAQADPEFRTFLSRLNGSRWFLGVGDQSFLELQGDIITRWNLRNSEPSQRKEFSVKLEKRRFVAKTSYQAAIYEISNDGDVITEEITYHETASFIGKVNKWLKFSNGSPPSR